MDNRIPTEVLLKIMGYLSGKEQVKLRRVCTRFKRIVDDFSCDHWKEICLKEFGDVQKAHSTSGLGWKELYKSLSLWPIVNRAKMDTYDSHDLNLFGYMPTSGSWGEERQFILLKNGLISYPQFQEFQVECMECGYYDLISYFDSETLRIVKQVCFDMVFESYDENDDVIVFREHDEGLLMFVPKTTDGKWEPILIEKLKEDIEEYSTTDFFLAKNSNDVYYFSHDSFELWNARLVNINGAYNIEKCAVGHFEKLIVCISKLNETTASLLTDSGEIYYIIDNVIEYRDKIDRTAQPNSVIQQLKEHGMDWICPKIYKWLVPSSSSELSKVEFSKLKKSIIYQHANIIILGTQNRILHIYHNPYKNGQLNLHNAKPNLKIDLNIFHPVQEKAIHKDINQIDVVEIPNGHRIIMIYSHRLVAVELIHTQLTKRSIELIIKERRIKRHKKRGANYTKTLTWIHLFSAIHRNM